MKATKVFALVLLAAIISVIAWWLLSPSVEPTLAGAEAIKDAVVGLPAENCWRKLPETTEMVCNYTDGDRIYSVRFESGNITEVVRDSWLGGANKPPFNHLVESP